MRSHGSHTATLQHTETKSLTLLHIRKIFFLKERWYCNLSVVEKLCVMPWESSNHFETVHSQRERHITLVQRLKSHTTTSEVLVRDRLG